MDYERAMTTGIYTALGIVGAAAILVAFAEYNDPLVALLTLTFVCLALIVVFVIALWRVARRIERKLDALLALIYEEDGTVCYQLDAVLQNLYTALRQRAQDVWALRR